MVKIITKQELLLSPNIIQDLKNSIFIYPTDTIYGIGCDAANDDLVNKIREIKKREQNPFSVIVPSKKIILDNCVLSFDAILWLDKLPGPYTLVCPLKKIFISKNVIPQTNSLGIRMINSWFQDIVKKINIPIVTTSVNLSGDDFMTSINDLNNEIKDKVDYIIDDGILSGSPSTLVLLTKDIAQLIKR